MLFRSAWDREEKMMEETRLGSHRGRLSLLTSRDTLHTPTHVLVFHHRAILRHNRNQPDRENSDPQRRCSKNLQVEGRSCCRSWCVMGLIATDSNRLRRRAPCRIKDRGQVGFRERMAPVPVGFRWSFRCRRERIILGLNKQRRGDADEIGRAHV